MACNEWVVNVLQCAAMDEPDGVVVVTLKGDDEVGVRFGNLTPPMMVAAGMGVFMELNECVFVQNPQLVAAILSPDTIKKAAGLIAEIVELGRQLNGVLIGQSQPKPEMMGHKETIN